MEAAQWIFFLIFAQLLSGCEMARGLPEPSRALGGSQVSIEVVADNPPKNCKASFAVTVRNSGPREISVIDYPNAYLLSFYLNGRMLNTSLSIQGSFSEQTPIKIASDDETVVKYEFSTDSSGMLEVGALAIARLSPEDIVEATGVIVWLADGKQYQEGFALPIQGTDL